MSAAVQILEPETEVRAAMRFIGAQARAAARVLGSRADGALDVGPGPGWIAVTGPAQRLIEKAELIGVALEEVP